MQQRKHTGVESCQKVTDVRRCCREEDQCLTACPGPSRNEPSTLRPQQQARVAGEASGAGSRLGICQAHQQVVDSGLALEPLCNVPRHMSSQNRVPAVADLLCCLSSQLPHTYLASPKCTATRWWERPGQTPRKAGGGTWWGRDALPVNWVQSAWVTAGPPLSTGARGSSLFLPRPCSLGVLSAPLPAPPQREGWLCRPAFPAGCQLSKQHAPLHGEENVTNLASPRLSSPPEWAAEPSAAGGEPARGRREADTFLGREGMHLLPSNTQG